MPVRQILRLGDPRLRQPCDPVLDPGSPEIAALVCDLRDTLRHARETTGYGRGIAAPQIGVMRRVVYLAVPGKAPMVLLNPRITWRSPERMVVWDACLSFLEIFMQVERAREIVVEYTDENGVARRLDAGAQDDLSELLQHEIDHLDGILALDRVVDVRSFCLREEFENRYRDSSPYAGTSS